MSLKEKIENDLKEAMRAKDALKLSCLRLVKSAVKNKEIDVRGALDDSQVIAILSTLAKQRKESIEQFKKGGRDDLVKQEEAELAVLETYLPKQMSEKELEEIVIKTIAETGAKGPQEMGKVMKALMPKITGKADGKEVSALVQKKLTP
ncbi:MAG: GatB/YqeY domain-containing protein [Deltaproteobacteria bacterium]|nr:GatB/YqeY domain-containing protein [Deltaproteobacteria bacterium]